MKKLIFLFVIIIQINCGNIKSEHIINGYYTAYYEGDSITSCMPLNYLQYNAINLAVAGSRINDVYQRVTETVFAVQPGCIIILIGINNLFSSNFSISEYKKLIGYLHLKYSKSRIICVSILPVEIKGMNEKNVQANSKIELFCKESGFVYLDVYKEMFLPAYRVDGLHLSETGYKKLTSFYNRFVREQEFISR